MKWLIVLIVLDSLLITGTLIAQLPPIQLQAGAAQRYPTLQEVVRAKLDLTGEKPKLVFMLPAYRTEKKEGTFRVIRVRPEQRVRQVEVNGKQVEQTYTVMVPFTEIIDGPELSVAAGDKPHFFDLDDFRFVDLEGNPLTIAETAARLNTLKPAFLMERFMQDSAALPELQRATLRPDVVIILSANEVRPRAEDSQTRILQIMPASE